MEINDPEIKDILKKYKSKLESNTSKKLVSEFIPDQAFTREYEKFREEALTQNVSSYEQFCNAAEKILRVNPGKKFDELQKNIEIAHLNVTPIGAASFATLIAIFLVLIGLIIGAASFFLGNPMIILPLLLILGGLIIVKPLTNIPNYIATRWRLKASNQMVLCILYIVMFMRHTSNLENAIKFSAHHIKEPLSLDLRKIFWDIETGKYSTLKESLDNYLVSWRDWNLEFINSFHLIESSLYEPNETRRVELLDKSLEVILEGIYERMLHYAHELNNPITMLHMLGIVLPILGLVIFPLMGSFLGGLIKWWHLAILYNILLPILVITLGNNILIKRPTGYGESEIDLEDRGNPFFAAFFIASIFIIIGLMPLILYITDPGFDIEFGTFGKFLDYKDKSGPYGVGALIFSLFIPLGLAFGIGTYYKLKTRGLMKQRKETKDLETEFASSLFQLGNRIGDGIPAEIAFEKVAITMHGTPSGNFFSIVSSNIRNLGMNIKEAVFNKKNGAILYYPSSLIESSMKVLVESSMKGPQIVARSLTSISNYIKRIHEVNERLRDLLADIVASMKAQISFLAPVIAGIVVGIASMIVNIIGKLGDMLAKVSAEGEGAESLGNLGDIASIFNIKDVIPSYFFQLVVGIYVVEIVFILTKLSNSIENGVDRLGEEDSLARNMIRSIFIYIIVSLIVILIFNALAATILTATEF